MPILYLSFIFDIVIYSLGVVIHTILDLFSNLFQNSSSTNNIYIDNIWQYIIFSHNYYIYELPLNNGLMNSLKYLDGLVCGIILGIKACLMIFVFIWARASFPRIRFDQLMLLCWIDLLPLVIGFIVLIPCILHSFDILPSSILIL